MSIEKSDSKNSCQFKFLSIITSSPPFILIYQFEILHTLNFEHITNYSLINSSLLKDLALITSLFSRL